ncbi:MAG TPA: regulatory protein RecX [Mycobacteriales bacterium]|nr:regulatory protein RecX [Mycobacteriales bacterium]
MAYDETGALRGRCAPAPQPPDHPEDSSGDPESVAREICLTLLASRARTRAELATSLARRGVPEEAVDRVLSRFAEVGLVDDRAFAEAFVASRHAGQGLARRALATELRHRGVDPGTAATALDRLDEQAELATARALVRRRSGVDQGQETRVWTRRAVGMLVRKGYSPGMAYQAVRAELAAEGVEVTDEMYVDTEGWDPVDVETE